MLKSNKSFLFQDFVRLIPNDKGDIFWTHLELLRKCKFVGMFVQLLILMILDNFKSKGGVFHWKARIFMISYDLYRLSIKNYKSFVNFSPKFSLLLLAVIQQPTPNAITTITVSTSDIDGKFYFSVLRDKLLHPEQ